MHSSLDMLAKACEDSPNLRVRIALDCIDKGYASHQQVADFLGIERKYWLEFYCNFKEGDISRIPQILQEIVPARDLPLFTGFTDEQLGLLERVFNVPLLVCEALDEESTLLQELRILVGFGVLLNGKHNQFNSYKLKI